MGAGTSPTEIYARTMRAAVLIVAALAYIGFALSAGESSNWLVVESSWSESPFYGGMALAAYADRGDGWLLRTGVVSQACHRRPVNEPAGGTAQLDVEHHGCLVGAHPAGRAAAAATGGPSPNTPGERSP